jgi:putative transposase
MQQNKSFKYRLYPTSEHTELFAKTFGCVRYVWNTLLDWRSKEYTLNANKINYLQTSSKLTEIKKTTEWLKEVSSVALQQTLRNQDVAFSNFFRKDAKYPNFKKKSNHQSFQLMENAFNIEDGKVYIAKSKEPLNIKLHRPLEGKPSSLTISKDCANRYFVSFCVEVDIEPLPALNKTIGIDLGLTDFLITSDGEKVKPLKTFIKYQKRLKLVQQRMRTKIKGSKNRNKVRVQVAKIYNKIVDCRKDFQHKLSTKLVRENQTISLEKLNIAGMIKNHKLAKHIQDAGWSEFVRQLKYKAEWYGRTIIQVSTWFPSSKLCSDCGFRVDKMPLNIRNWTCSNCGEHHDRDVNAARNINTAGLAEIKAWRVSSAGDLGTQVVKLGKKQRPRKSQARAWDRSPALQGGV